jgi:hypothetical protein
VALVGLIIASGAMVLAPLRGLPRPANVGLVHVHCVTSHQHPNHRQICATWLAEARHSPGSGWRTLVVLGYAAFLGATPLIRRYGDTPLRFRRRPPPPGPSS